MKLYQNFKNKFLGRSIDWDKKYGNQCVDAYRQYCHELGFPQSPPVKGAVNIWDTCFPKYFKRIANTPKGIPEEGDVIIWGTGVSSYGHCAIFDHGDVNGFVSLDQNWPFDNGEGVLHEQKHNYKGVLGWLKPKLSPEEPQEHEIEIPVAEIENYSEKNNVILKKISPMIGEIHDFIPKWRTELKSANKKIDKLKEEIDNVDEERRNFQRLYKKKNKVKIKKRIATIFNKFKSLKNG